MKTNVGGIDRILRILLGIALIGATLTEQIGIWGWLGLLPLLTGVIGFCPAYLPFGLNSANSCPMKKKS